MSAFFVATVSINHPEKFQTYAQKAGETIRAFGGEIIARGKAEAALAGELDHHTVGVVKFPDMATLENWYQSDGYQAIIGLRDEAADVAIVTYAQPA